MKRALVLACALLLLVSPLEACGSSGPLRKLVLGTCVPAQVNIVPSSSSWVRVWTSQAVTVRPGMFVGLEVVEPEGYSGPGRGFPWSDPVVTTGGVLTPTQPCSSSPPSTLPLAVYWFQATSSGSTVVTVPLALSWKRQHYGCPGDVACARLSDLRVVVAVKGTSA